MKKKITCLIMVLTIWFTGSTYAQTWNGSVSNDWNTPDNWSPSGVPSGIANVTIPGTVTSGNWPVFAGNVTINSIDMQPGCQLNVNGFTLTINGVNMIINFSGAVINNSNSATDIVFNINTGINGFVTYFRSNTINDNIVFNLTGTNQFIEAAATPPNVYHGNVIFNINDVLTTYISYGFPSQFKGNLTVSRTVAGPTSLFYAGGTVTGNFTYTNNTSSAVSIGNPSFKTAIAGTVNITANNTTASPFEMYRVVNQTTGGTITVQNSQGFNVQNDTLLVAALSITGYRGSQYANLMNNGITGNVTMADDASYGGGFLTYIRNNVITGNSNFSNNGSNIFAEADVTGSGNIYNGNATFNGAGGTLLIGYGAPLLCTGNLSINRTIAGTTSMFNAGATINGNFTYINNTAGETGLGNLAVKTSIGGTVNITANFTTPNNFGMHRLVNQTNGGSITVTNSQGFSVQKDTLLLTAMNITGYKSGQYALLFNNAITGNVTIADDASYSGGFTTNIRGNVITGNSIFTISGINTFAEADGVDYGNRYNGNLTFNCAGNGNVFISYLDTTQCTGNLTINRTAAGLTSAFNSGAVIGGNFTYTNNTAGETGFGNLAYKTSIVGTINITANFSTPNNFGMHRLVNQTIGGSITVTNSQGFNVQNDTLLLTAMNITGYKGGQYAYLINNSITGNVTIADDISYSGGYYTYVRNNTINGNSSFSNNGSNVFAEADGLGYSNRYNGDVTFTGASSASVFIAYLDTLHCTGNLTINRTAVGQTSAFNAGARINGNFTYINNTAGETGFGNLASKTSIGGTINIIANFSTPNNFGMHRLVNQTNGGSITVTNSLGFSVQNDTLLITELNITGYRGNQYGYFYNNTITGNVNISNDISYSGGYYTYIRSNIINGNTSITNNGSNVLFDADMGGTGNKYLGNVTYIKTGAGISVGANDVDEISGNLTLNSTVGIGLGKIKFNGSTNGVVEQLGTQSISISELIMEKTGSGKITLNDPVTITTLATFNSGNINSSIGNELIFSDNSDFAEATDASFADGPVIKIGNDAFSFPVGKTNKIAPVNITAPALTTNEFRAQYFMSIPHNSGYDSSQRGPGINHISAKEYWLLDRINGTSGVTVTLSWQTARSGIINSIPDLRVARWDGTMWRDEGNGGTAGTNAAGTLMTAAAVTNFSPFTLASATPLNPLPVNLVFFNAILRTDHSVLLQWKTGQEINNAYFDVQRSTDGRNWVKIAMVLPQASQEYEYLDNGLVEGIYYYRLRHVDISGDFKYSDIKVIRTKTDNKLVIWPNPVIENLFVQTPFANGNLEITDLSGRIMMRMEILNNSVTTIRVQQLAKGLYFIRIRHNDEVLTTRFVKE